MRTAARIVVSAEGRRVASADFVIAPHTPRRDVVSAVKRPHREGGPRKEKPVGFTTWTFDGWLGLDLDGKPVGPHRAHEVTAAFDVAYRAGLITEVQVETISA